MKILKYSAFISLLFLWGTSTSYCQKTPEEFGTTVFNAFNKDSLGNLYRLIPTLEEFGALAEELGITKGSEDYKQAISVYPASLEEFKHKVLEIVSDTLDNKLNWGKAKLEKVTWHEYKEDSLSKTVPVITLTIRFTCNENTFRIVMDDTFKFGGVWKMGNNIYMQKLKSSK